MIQKVSSSDLITLARKEVLVSKNCPKALEILNNSALVKETNSQKKLFFKNTLALTYLENKEYKKAAEIYKEIDEKYQAGFCELLLGNEDEAEKLWNKAPESCPCLWGKCLLNFIRMKKGPKPTFLQVRNHLENDIGYFIQAKKTKYAENVLKNSDVLISVNLESYKLLGKVLLNHNFLNPAKKYLLKSLDVIPDDAETFYYLGRYNYMIGAYKECKSILEKCIELNEQYIPAKNLICRVEMNLNKLW